VPHLWHMLPPAMGVGGVIVGGGGGCWRRVVDDMEEVGEEGGEERGMRSGIFVAHNAQCA